MSEFYNSRSGLNIETSDIRGGDRPLPKNKIVYIASSGRSGSTLLESILGAHPVLVNGGELQTWPCAIVEGGAFPCGCGSLISECVFWARMLEEVDPLNQKPPRINFFREYFSAGRTLRLRRVFENYCASILLTNQKKIYQYGINNQKLFHYYQLVAQESRPDRIEYLVDSSKDPYRLEWLARSGLFSLKIIHLVKDPRSFVYSVLRDQIRKGDAVPFNLITTSLRKSLSWYIQNSLFSRVASQRIPNTSYLRLRYEDLASDPDNSIRVVCNYLDIPFDSKLIHSFRENRSHTVAGNPMRFRNDPIQLDEEWRIKMPTMTRKVVEYTLGRKIKQYGYKFD